VNYLDIFLTNIQIFIAVNEHQKL